jgi:hypothetical protein
MLYITEEQGDTETTVATGIETEINVAHCGHDSARLGSPNRADQRPPMVKSIRRRKALSPALSP